MESNPQPTSLPVEHDSSVSALPEVVVRLSDLIGVISDEFQPALKIIDSRVISK